MSRTRDTRRDSARGQVLVIVAGGLIGLLAIAALVLESGTLMLNRRDGQNSSDLASIAGARIVALNYTDAARTQADVYAAVSMNMTQNNCGVASSAPCAWTAEFVGAGLVTLGPVTNTVSALPTGALGVRAKVTRSPGAIVGRILGFATWTVSTEATAIAAKPSSFPSGTLLPIAMCGWFSAVGNDCAKATNTPSSNAIDFQKGQIYDLTDGSDAPGGFGWLSWDGSNSGGALATALCTPSNPPFSLDSPFDSAGAYDGYIGTNLPRARLVPDRSRQDQQERCASLPRWVDHERRDGPCSDL